jgi:hypothetical protein
MSSGPPTYPVTGTVTLDGAPLQGATVVFVPQDSGENQLPVQAFTDETGTFTMISLFDNGRTEKPGMQPGSYGVEVTQLEEPNGEAGLRQRPKNLLPPRYAKAATSGLTAEVKAEGENNFVLALER